jgi:hypothetical protein
MPHTIATRDVGSETDQSAEYKFVFEGSDKPEFADVHNATPSPNARIYQNNKGNWVVEDMVWGGIDAWEYTNSYIRLAFRDPSRHEIQVNDLGWTETDEFSETDTFAGGSEPSKDQSDSGGEDDGKPEPPSGERDSSLPASWRDVSGPVENERPRYGNVNRRGTTVDHTTHYVGFGDFRTGDGSKSDPFGTLMDALNFMPEQVRHEYIIQVLPGTHGGEPGNSINTDPHRVGGIKTCQATILGDRDNPENHVLEANQWNMEYIGVPLSSKIAGMKVRGTVQSYGGGFAVEDSIIVPNGRWGNNRSYAVDTYGGTVMINQSSIRDGQADTVFNLTDDATIELGGNVKIDADCPLVSAGIGGGKLTIHPGAEINVPVLNTGGYEPSGIEVVDMGRQTSGLSPGNQVIRHGPNGRF